jgi:hypothetical protein
MALGSFGYTTLRSDKIEDWAEYGPKFLGLQLVERTRSALKFRMDDRKQRIVISSEEPAGNVFGWEVADAAALDALAARLESAGIGVEHAPAAIASLRGVRDLIRFRTPPATGSRPFTAPRLPMRRSCLAGRSRASAPAPSAWATSSCTSGAWRTCAGSTRTCWASL